jgi:hypothetical protein
MVKSKVVENALVVDTGTVFAPRTHGPPRITPKALARELTPPVVFKWMRRLFSKT